MRHAVPARLSAYSAGALTIAAIAALPSHAAAAGQPYTCEASALAISVLGQAAVEPVVTNRGLACQSSSAGIGNLTQPLPPIFGASAVNAATAFTGTQDRQDLQQAVAAGGVADARLAPLGQLGLTLPLDQIPLPPALKQVNVDISSVTGTLNLLLAATGIKLPNTLTVDIEAAVRELVKLPDTDVLNVKSALAFAGGQCVNGAPQLNSARDVAGASVLGNAIDLNAPGETPIVDTQNIDFSKLDLSKVTLPLPDGLTAGLLSQVLAKVNPLVASTLKSLPPIALPIDLAKVTVTPGSEVRTADAITQTGPGVAITVLGQPVADLTLGQAKVGSAGVDCTPPKAVVVDPPTTATDTALECTKRKLVLVDVLQRGNKVLLKGAADKKFVGQFVTIKFEGDGSTAARALVAPDGSFDATAPLPSKALRATNRARYQAIIGRETSLDLKLVRRMTVTQLSSADGKVTIAGRVSLPLGKPLQDISLRRRLSCKTSVVVKRFKPRPDGTFSVTVDAPEGQTAAVYRLATKVRFSTKSAKLFPTFTLPRGVDLNR